MMREKNEAKKANKMIIYIDGFGGSGEGNKARAFMEYFRAIGDELLNPEDALVKLEGCKMVVEDGGNQGFEGIERDSEEIEKFFEN